LSANISSTGSSVETTRASLAGVSPRDSRTSSSRGTSTSTELMRERLVRERGRLGSGVEVEPVQGEEVVDDVELVGPRARQSV
jgi:hypothetical protein